MDSISQFVLGASVGQAVLGKKLGNRAMIWGGIGGTIPDLDVIASPLMSEVDALAFHRGISHSIPFAIVGGALFGWMLYKLYNRKPGPDDDRYVSLKGWQFMFFMAFLTHSLLDCFTMYGTQLFAPFTNARVAFSTISVADPMYTLPFLVFLIISALHKKHLKRRFWNYIGIGWSCLYLSFTVINKINVQGEYCAQLDEQGIVYSDFILGPTILNNVLWSATVQTDSVYYQGMYSLFDDSPIEFRAIQKNHDLIETGGYDRTLNILKWFTAGYYNILSRSDGKLQFNDLRYGTFRGTGDGENDYVFRFILERHNGHFVVEEAKGGPEPGEEKQMMAQLWNRIKGQ